MISYDYAYDLINHPYLSELIDPSDGEIVQTLTVPEGVRSIHGFRVKVSRYGNPGPIRYKIGRADGEVEIARGEIRPGQVMPVFEQMVGEDFPPATVFAGESLYISLQVSAGEKPLDAYRVYGPNTLATTGGPGNIRTPYWWYEDYEIDDDMDIPIPRDYQGACLPEYTGGVRYHKDGARAFNLSFAILTDADDGYPQRGEQTFEFLREILAPPFSEYRTSCDANARPQEGELEITPDWHLEAPRLDAPILTHSLEDLNVFFEAVMGVELGRRPGGKTIRIEIDASDSGWVDEESFRARVEDDRIALRAGHVKGVMRAIYWLEDQMLTRHAPILETGEFAVDSRYRLRMVPGVYPAPGYYPLQEAHVWTPGYLWRLSRAGYNAIYFQTNLEELVEDSAIFPEMNDANAPFVLERLRRFTTLAAQFGIDVYLDLKTGYFKKFSESVYERLPEIRTFPKWGNHPCGGQQIVLDFYRETLRNAFRVAPMLKGLVIIYDTEGFYSCFLHNKKDQCPYCKDFTVEELSNRLFNTLLEAIRSTDRQDTEMILWSYFCDEPWNFRVLEAMPEDVTVMSCFSQFRKLDRFGVQVRTDDYSICSEDPSEYFLKIQEIANRKGLRFITKTEDTFGQEFVSTPYTPCLTQHQRRWDQVGRQSVDGYLAQYIHLGFMPGPCADLTRQNNAIVRKDGELLETSAEGKLTRVAMMRYGESAAPHILSAWDAFSTAIRDYFPYTWGVCRYPGPLQAAPAQPFYFDAEKPMLRLRSRGYVKDLRWTGIDARFLVDKEQKWDADLVSRCLQYFRRYYRQGILHLERALDAAEPPYRAEVQAVLNVAKTQLIQVRSLLNLIQFFTLRGRYHEEPSASLVSSLIYVCENELENAYQALELATQDSCLGFSCEGAGTVRGGLFTPQGIRQKIDSLYETLDSLYRQG